MTPSKRSTAFFNRKCWPDAALQRDNAERRPDQCKTERVRTLERFVKDEDCQQKRDRWREILQESQRRKADAARARCKHRKRDGGDRAGGHEKPVLDPVRGRKGMR